MEKIYVCGKSVVVDDDRPHLLERDLRVEGTVDGVPVELKYFVPWADHSGGPGTLSSTAGKLRFQTAFMSGQAMSPSGWQGRCTIRPGGQISATTVAYMPTGKHQTGTSREKNSGRVISLGETETCSAKL